MKETSLFSEIMIVVAVAAAITGAFLVDCHKSVEGIFQLGPAICCGIGFAAVLTAILTKKQEG